MHKVGYGRKTIEENIRVLVEERGLDLDRATRATMKLARKVFEKRNPNAPMPEYLRGEEDA